MLDSYLIGECRYGLMTVARGDREAVEAFTLHGEAGEFEIRLFAKLVRRGHTVVEVGAAVGWRTLPLSRLVGPSGQVHAFEPRRLAFQSLCANLALNGVENVSARRELMGDMPGHAKLSALEPSHNGADAEDPARDDEVPLATLDGLALERCDFVRIDARGREREVLSGADRVITHLRPVLYIRNELFATTEARERSAAILGMLLERSYKLFWHCPPLFNPDNFRRIGTNRFPHRGSMSVLALPLTNQAIAFGELASGLHPITDEKAVFVPDWLDAASMEAGAFGDIRSDAMRGAHGNRAPAVAD